MSDANGQLSGPITGGAPVYFRAVADLFIFDSVS